MRRLLTLGTVSSLVLVLWSSDAQAAPITFHFNDLATFNTAGGTPPIAIDFDGLSSGSIVGALAGLTLTSPDGNSLVVVDASTTSTAPGYNAVYTNKLVATSGANVLSPGGASLVPGNALAEQYSLLITFNSPVQAFGLDMLFQSLDCCTFLSYTVLGAGNVTLLTDAVPSTNGLGGGAPAGSIFLGWTSTTNDIVAIRLTETDDDATFPDNNYGYDTFRFGSAPTAVPEPGTLALLAGGLATLVRKRRVRSRR